MCSIMGYLGTDLTEEEFKAHFDKTISRGPDMTRIIDVPGAILGFERLSIMGLSEEGMQPFNLNGNAYNFKRNSRYIKLGHRKCYKYDRNVC